MPPFETLNPLVKSKTKKSSLKKEADWLLTEKESAISPVIPNIH